VERYSSECSDGGIGSKKEKTMLKAVGVLVVAHFKFSSERQGGPATSVVVAYVVASWACFVEKR
jgi:hypothetical protein